MPTRFGKDIRAFGSWYLSDEGVACPYREIQIPPSALKNWDVAGKTRQALWQHIDIVNESFAEFMDMLNVIDFAVYRFQPRADVVAKQWQPEWLDEPVAVVPLPGPMPKRERQRRRTVKLPWKRKYDPIKKQDRFLVLKRDGYKCRICGRGAGDGVKLHVDHIIPRFKGGKNELPNYWTLCRPCNLGKGTFDL